jgi:hypothetical protein
MNFEDFFEKICDLSNEIEENGLNPDDVDVIYTKSSGNDIIACICNDNVVCYFKW